MTAPSAQTLQRLGSETGLQPGTLEKVMRLLDVAGQVRPVEQVRDGAFQRGRRHGVAEAVNRLQIVGPVRSRRGHEAAGEVGGLENAGLAWGRDLDVLAVGIAVAQQFQRRVIGDDAARPATRWSRPC